MSGDMRVVLKICKKVCHDEGTTPYEDGVVFLCCVFGCFVCLAHAAVYFSLQTELSCYTGKVFCRHGSLHLGLSEIVFGLLWEKTYHLTYIFIADHAYDNVEGMWHLVQLSAEVLPSSYVVPCVADSERFAL